MTAQPTPEQRAEWQTLLDNGLLDVEDLVEAWAAGHAAALEGAETFAHPLRQCSRPQEHPRHLWMLARRGFQCLGVQP